MKTKIKYFVLFMFLLLLVVAAMITPRILSVWYDKHTLGQLTYEDMDYEPYRLSPYHSFGDKLEAIAIELAQGTNIYQIKLREKTDSPNNQELIEVMDKELKALYENGILPQEYSVQRIEERSFYQAYVVPVNHEGTLLQGICFWHIVAETEDGYLMLTMDSSFYKIYAVRMDYGAERIYDVTKDWIEEQSKDFYLSLTEAWCKYWELDEVTIENIYLYDDITENTIDIDIVYGAGSVYGIRFPEGHQFYTWSWYSNYCENIEEAILFTGMREFSP